MNTKEESTGIENMDVSPPSEEKKDKGAKISLREALGITLFLPLVLIANSDLANLTANQVMIMADVGLTIVQWTSLVALGIIVSGACTFFFGYLSDKYSRKWLLIIGGGIWAAATFMFTFSPTPAMMYVSRVLGSVGLGAITPVTFSLLSDMFPSEKRSKSFAWWGIATLIGSLFGAALGLSFNRIPFEEIVGYDTWDIATQMLYLKEVYPELVVFWRHSYLLIAIVALVCTLLCLLVSEPKRAAKEKHLRDLLANDELQYSYKIKKGDLKYIFTRRSNFWLIFNFLDVVSTGFFLANIMHLINNEMQFALDNPVSIGQLLAFFLPALGLGLFGQFYFSKVGDTKVKRGDPAGRVKVAILCGIAHIPFLIIGFLFLPNKVTQTFFLGSLVVPAWAFWHLMVVMGLILGVGLMFSFGIAPNWYASLIDVNLPEHRGTMIAIASFMDTIGRAFGAFVGGLLISYFDGSGIAFSTAVSIVWMTAVFGTLSGLMWIPIYWYCNEDFSHIQEMIKQRRKEIS